MKDSHDLSFGIGSQVSYLVFQCIVCPWRTWYSLITFRNMLMIGETIGYVGRVGSAYDVTLNNYFLVQIVCLIISPAFFSAALYVTIGNLYSSSLHG